MPSSLITAINNDNFDLAKTLVLENENNIINVPDEEGNFPIHLVTNLSLYDEISVEKKSKLDEIAIALLEKGASPTVCDQWGTHPIHYVALSGNLTVFKKLIEKGEDVNTTDLADETPLHQALRKKNDVIIDFIFSQGPIKLKTTKGDNLNQIDYSKKYYSDMLEKLLKVLETPSFEIKQKKDIIENPQELRKQLLQTICKHIADKDPSSVEKLKVCLEQSKQLGINLAKAQLPHHAAWTSCTLVEYFHWNTDCISPLYKDKRSLVYQYGISPMQSEWGRDVEIAEARVREITEDYNYYGNWNYGAERAKHVQSFLGFWKGTIKKQEKMLMVFDANQVHLSDYILDARVRDESLTNLTVSLDIIAAFKDFLTLQTSWEPLDRAKFLARLYTYEKKANENILKKEIVLAIESESPKSANKLRLLLEKAKKSGLNLADITVFFRTPIEYVLKYGTEQKFMTLCQYGFDLTPNRQEFKPFLVYIHRKHSRLFSTVVKLYGPDELDDKGYTYLYSLTKQFEDHLRFQSGPAYISEIESQKYLSGIFDAVKILLSNNTSNLNPKAKPTLVEVICDIWNQFPCAASMQLINLFITYGGKDFFECIATLQKLKDDILNKTLQQDKEESTLSNIKKVLDTLFESIIAYQGDVHVGSASEEFSKSIRKHCTLSEVQKNINGLIIEYLEPELVLPLLFSKMNQGQSQSGITLTKSSLKPDQRSAHANRSQNEL